VSATGAEEQPGAERAELAAGATAVRGSAWAIASHVLPFAVTMVVSIVAARILGPDGMGRQSFIAFVVMAVTTLCMAGLPAAIVKYTGDSIGRRDPAALAHVAAFSTRVAVAAGAAGGLAIASLALFGAEPALAWVFAGIAVWAGVLHKVPGSLLIGAQRWRQAAVVTLVVTVASAVAVVVVLALGGGVTGMVAVGSASTVATLVATWLIARRFLRETASSSAGPPEGQRRRMIGYGAAATFPLFLQLIVFSRSEFFFLERWSTDDQIAMYSIAFATVAGIAAIPVALANVVAPAVATLHGAGEHERIASGFSRALRLLATFTFPLVATSLALGPSFLERAYGDEYTETATIFLILAAVLILSPFRATSNALLFGAGRMRAPVVASAIAAVVDIGLAIALVQSLEARGAAIANVSAQLAAGVLTILAAWRVVGRLDLRLATTARVVPAAAVGGGAALGVVTAIPGIAGLVAGLVAGLLAYVAAGAAFRVLTPVDAEWFGRALPDRTERFAGPLLRLLSEGRLRAT
jgi:O-antigen/teichoic acid export membrane protein